MGLIKQIMSRKPKHKIKADIKYLDKVNKKLRKSVDAVNRIVTEITALERSLSASKGRDAKRVKAQIANKKKSILKSLKNLEEAVSLYFKIDDIRTDYSEEEKNHLGELQKYWHSIKLERLPPKIWSEIVEVIVENDLQNARLLFG